MYDSGQPKSRFWKYNLKSTDKQLRNVNFKNVFKISYPEINRGLQVSCIKLKIKL
jgi:hypothetical protein